MPKKHHHRKIYIVSLTDHEKTTLLDLTNKGVLSARKLKRAHILLLANEGNTDSEIAHALSTSRPTVERTRKRFVTVSERGAEARHPLQQRRSVPPAQRGGDGTTPQHVILAAAWRLCAPVGRSHFVLERIKKGLC